jgi:hypothetical protein
MELLGVNKKNNLNCKCGFMASHQRKGHHKSLKTFPFSYFYSNQVVTIVIPFSSLNSIYNCFDLNPAKIRWENKNILRFQHQLQRPFLRGLLDQQLSLHQQT